MYFQSKSECTTILQISIIEQWKLYTFLAVEGKMLVMHIKYLQKKNIFAGKEAFVSFHICSIAP